MWLLHVITHCAREINIPVGLGESSSTKNTKKQIATCDKFLEVKTCPKPIRKSWINSGQQRALLIMIWVVMFLLVCASQ